MMKTYIGTKIIQAAPLRNSNGVDGYQVMYPDGYTSWSPKEPFEEAYRETTGINFGLALEAMKRGMCVTRRGWNGKDMYLYLVRAKNLENGLHPDGDNEYGFVDVVAMKTAYDVIQVGWLATQTDMLSDDWQILA